MAGFGNLLGICLGICTWPIFVNDAQIFEKKIFFYVLGIKFCCSHEIKLNNCVI